MKVVKQALGYLPVRFVVRMVPWWLLQTEIVINPVEVTRIVVSKDTKNFYISGLLYSDNTDIQCIDENFMHTTIREMYIEKKHFTQTKQYLRMLNAVNLFQNKQILDPSLHGGYWCKTKEDVNRYFGELEKTFNSIQASGYKSQKELISEGSSLVKGRGFDDLKFLIDADGSIVFFGSGGNHRFSICRLLGISNLTGILVGMHRDFYLKNVSGIISYNDYVRTLRSGI